MARAQVREGILRIQVKCRCIMAPVTGARALLFSPFLIVGAPGDVGACRVMACPTPIRWQVSQRNMFMPSAFFIWTVTLCQAVPSFVPNGPRHLINVQAYMLPNKYDII